MKKHQIKREMLYYQIKALQSEGFKVSQISKKLGVSRTTVYFYQGMDEAAFATWSAGVSQKPSSLAPYEESLKRRLRQHPDISSYQLHDWLLEHYPEVKIGRRALSNYIAHLREIHQIPKPPGEQSGRQYCGVEDLAYGQQAQVDFGFYEMTDQNGARQKIRFMATVLSRSRHKHLYFLDRPFRTRDVIEAQEAALAFYGGIPRQFVYDQDKLMVVSENHGELLFTAQFEAYLKARKFELFVCRRSDPESKGKVENVVKYVKSNFLKHRIYKDIAILNAEAMAWLDRTGNGQVHGTTKQVPAEAFLIEKAHLHPLTPLSLEWLMYQSYQVRKDNIILYKSNRYSLPVGTYRGSKTKVWVREQAGELVLFNHQKQELARHKIPVGKGLMVCNTNHKRDNSAKIEELIKQVSDLFEQSETAEEWLRQIQQKRSRYIRDQVLLIKKTAQKYPGSSCDKALSFCVENSIYSAVDFASVVQVFNKSQAVRTQPPPPEKLLLNKQNRQHMQVQAHTSDITDYENIIQNL